MIPLDLSDPFHDALKEAIPKVEALPPPIEDELMSSIGRSTR